jgi:hypothetical protein
MAGYTFLAVWRSRFLVNPENVESWRENLENSRLAAKLGIIALAHGKESRKPERTKTRKRAQIIGVPRLVG